jgi:hypothetical protein
LQVFCKSWNNFSSWNNFFLKKKFDFIFFAVILRAFFVEQFAHRGTIYHANLVFLVKIFNYFLIVFIYGNGQFFRMTKSLPLLASNSDAKTSKGFALKFLTDILYLAPANEGGFGNLCVHASAGCLAVCLFTAGRGRMSNVRLGRIRKTRLFFTDKKAFFMQLNKDIVRGMKRAAKLGMTYCVRLNGTSDVPWERLGVMEQFPTVQFYDYTKSVSRALAHARGEMPANYHLTFSRSESNEVEALQVLAAGGNVAAVFESANHPETWNGYNVVSGDDSDLRFLDAKNVVVALYAKGKAKQDKSGFVIKTSVNA